MNIKVKDLNVVTAKTLFKERYFHYSHWPLAIGIVINDIFYEITRGAEVEAVKKNAYNRDILDSLSLGDNYVADINKVSCYCPDMDINQEVTVEIVNEIIARLQSVGYKVITPIGKEEAEPSELRSRFRVITPIADKVNDNIEEKGVTEEIFSRWLDKVKEYNLNTSRRGLVKKPVQKILNSLIDKM